jgi:hypothetical protein
LSRHLGSKAIEEDRGYGDYTIFGHAAAEQRDEVATAAHSITSSARASSVGEDFEAEHPGSLCVDDELD